MYEEYGKNTTVSLKVKRTIGVLGTVSVSWQAEPREATFLDFGPPSGSVTLMDGEKTGEIIITIIDDLEAEEMEVLNQMYRLFCYSLYIVLLKHTYINT